VRPKSEVSAASAADSAAARQDIVPIGRMASPPPASALTVIRMHNPPQNARQTQVAGFYTAWTHSSRSFPSVACRLMPLSGHSMKHREPAGSAGRPPCAPHFYTD
jgi:hypothetical protein